MPTRHTTTHTGAHETRHQPHPARSETRRGKMSWFGGASGGATFDPDNDVASLRQQLALEREGKEKLAQIVARASGGSVLSELQHQLDVEKAERARAATLLTGEAGGAKGGAGGEGDGAGLVNMFSRAHRARRLSTFVRTCSATFLTHVTRVHVRVPVAP